jgi:hypothetical protein
MDPRWTAGGWLRVALLATVLSTDPGGGFPALAQALAQVVVDSPADGRETGPNLTVRGWALVPGQPYPGVDAVAVYQQGAGDAPREFLGMATYGLPRPDVAASLGRALPKNQPARPTLWAAADSA